MRLLVLGGGGREHALAWKLAQSPHAGKIYCAPGNPGIAQLAECVDISPADVSALLAFARATAIDLTIVGPEAPLVAGIVDSFAAAGLAIVGPTRAAAMIEGSKAFAKVFMRRHGIPTAAFEIFEDFPGARSFLEKCRLPIVIKADGLAAGKGAVVAHTHAEAIATAAAMLERRLFGQAGSRIVIEEFMPGEEVSVLCLSDGANILTLPAAQDHKAVFDHDRGPNTGGMGAYAPAPVMTPALLAQVENEILRPTIAGLAAEGRPYRGVLYAGLMITAAGPRVVEFNCRLGDPEAQVIVPLLEFDLVELFWQMAHGTLPATLPAAANGWALTVVMASAGYPGEYQTGRVISGLPLREAEEVLVFHSGTARDAAGRLITNGGRVLAVTGLGRTFEQARQRAYAAVGKISFEGAHYRTDIGAKARRHLGGG
ncbi:MAG: phosphoribosylamine--glycine ligase [candidate division KSB1 bacterium]|nr:phosphoribosylamine--glycine ligase [candidate division KSB1 bacterium]MDZ7273493.1 phosphoribosylamine--glycine ligase [candidate division KSB1 bacterium]MDZ7286915.1 phosphoribosylamine--glycine ligase [candidate division KSB1 bacterium]MDZ7299732.1 phosphoribosylamine--glycine ligase [candidate division KSB1 bacterium]MDZ7305671.1 phosphoribosylamine--glycine ligase [candidate division KSB1 bacterium]